MVQLNNRVRGRHLNSRVTLDLTVLTGRSVIERGDKGSFPDRRQRVAVGRAHLPAVLVAES